MVWGFIVGLGVWGLRFGEWMRGLKGFKFTMVVITGFGRFFHTDFEQFEAF